VHLGAVTRRARQLLPAAYIVIAVSAVALVIWAPRLRWLQNFHEMLVSSAYFENWRLAHDAVDYLAQSNEPSAVQHY
jgi:peptidoglycan/LPS O-acetylase OafA/YrhL